MQASPKLAALVASVLFASTLGVLIGVGAFGLIRMVEQMGEGLGLIPGRWGENNPDLMVQISGLAAVPVVIWFVVWFYKKALKAEQNLQGYKYAPPPSPSTKL
jgi:hypothetical protein